MSLYGDIINQREENNIRLEESGDQSLLKDENVIRIENTVDDAQSAVLHILERFALTPERLYGFRSVPALLSALLEPLGIMFKYSKELPSGVRTRSAYVLAYRKDGKAVAIMPEYNGYRYYCPSDSGRGWVNSAFLAQLKEGYYELGRPLVQKQTVLRTFIWNIMNSLTLFDILFLFAATASATGLGMILAYISRWVYKVYIGGSSRVHSAFAAAVITYLSLMLVRGALSLVRSIFLSSIKIRISISMQSAVMAIILHKPHAYFRSTSSGKISTEINSCSRLTDIILEIFMDVLLNLSFSLVYLLQLKSFAPALFVPGLGFIVLRILASLISSVFNRDNEIRLLDLDMKYRGFLYSAIRGIQKVKGLGSESFIYSRWADMYRQRLSLTFKQKFFLKYKTEILAAITILTTIVLLSLTMADKELTAEDYLAFTASFTLIMTVVTGLTDIMDNMLLSGVLCQNIAPVLKNSTEDTEALEYVHGLKGDIRAENIVFSYDRDLPPCLKDVSVNIKRGEKVAIVGESGCGKSTLLKILLGMEIPLSGNVYYDNKSLYSMNLKSLRKCIGSVFQFSMLFPGTIAENITFGNEDYYDENRIWEAADDAVIGDYIRSLPLKLDTEISESNSCGFSGGQRQRLLLARAIFSRPKILFLDEATSALDNLTQTQVLENFQKLKCTVVMVAHRLSTVQHFDRIIMMEGGKIAEEGTYTELMEKNGLFARLVRRQVI